MSVLPTNIYLKLCAASNRIWRRGKKKTKNLWKDIWRCMKIEDTVCMYTLRITTTTNRRKIYQQVMDGGRLLESERKHYHNKIKCWNVCTLYRAFAGSLFFFLRFHFSIFVIQKCPFAFKRFLSKQLKCMKEKILWILTVLRRAVKKLCGTKSGWD